MYGNYDFTAMMMKVMMKMMMVIMMMIRKNQL